MATATDTNTRRRGNGEGSVYRKGSTGRWMAAVTVGRDRNGKPIKKTRTAKSRAEANLKLRELQNEMAAPWNDTPLGDCGMPEMVANCLMRRGLRTVGDLLDASWTMLLYQTPTLGSKRASMLLTWMEDEGLVVRPQQSLDPDVRERSAADCDARWRGTLNYPWRAKRYDPDPPSAHTQGAYTQGAHTQAAAAERDRNRVNKLGWTP